MNTAISLDPIVRETTDTKIQNKQFFQFSDQLDDSFHWS